MAPRDIYGRRPTSTSRGRTIERIMDLQHERGVLPGAEGVLADAPPGSIAAAIVGFHRGWVEHRQVTTRRAYERSLALFARDLAEQGPAPARPLHELAADRLAAHLDWRLRHGLVDSGELQRSALHLARFCEWAASELDAQLLPDARAWMRHQAAARIEAAPPAFHVATSADELRDTSADERLLDPPRSS